MAGVVFSRLGAGVLLVGSLLLLQACVSTEELYAEYDDSLCKLQIGAATIDEATEDVSQPVVVTQNDTNVYYYWTPAVYFDLNGRHLDEKSTALLEKSLPVLRAFPNLKIGLQGFTDLRGSTEHNFELAQLRISAVERFLVDAGISPDRILLQPVGEVVQQFGIGGKIPGLHNRRVQLSLLDEKGQAILFEYVFRKQ